MSGGSDMKKESVSDRVIHSIFGLGTVKGIHFDKHDNVVLEVKFDSLETIRCIMADFKGIEFVKD